MALDINNKPYSTEPQTKLSTATHYIPPGDHYTNLNQPFPTPTAEVQCQNTNQNQNDCQKLELLYYPIFNTPKITLQPIPTPTKTHSPPCVDHHHQLIDKAMAAEIEQYHKEMYAALNKAAGNTPLVT